MTPTARLVHMTSFDGSKAICADLNDNGPYQPLVFLDKDGLKRAENVPASLGFPLDSLGRIALVGEESEPRGEWRRGWLSKITGVFAKMEPDDLHRWECIEYRVVGEGVEKAKPKGRTLYGVEFDGNHVHIYATETGAKHVADQSPNTRQLVRLTVEPVEENSQ